MGRSPTAKGWVCITCGKIFGDDEEDARTHQNDKNIHSVTKSEDTEEWICLLCGTTFVDDEEDARTHELSTGNPDGKKHIITYR